MLQNGFPGLSYREFRLLPCGAQCVKPGPMLILTRYRGVCYGRLRAAPGVRRIELWLRGLYDTTLNPFKGARIMRGKIIFAGLVLAVSGAVASAQDQTPVPIENDLYCSGTVTTEAVPRSSYIITGEGSNYRITFRLRRLRLHQSRRGAGSQGRR